MDRNVASESPVSKPPTQGRVALNVLALCFHALGAWPRLGREFCGIPQADFGKLWLGSRASGFGLLAKRACRGSRGAAASDGCLIAPDPEIVYSAGTPVARRRVPDRRPRTIPLAVSVEPRALRRNRHRVYRQCAEFHPAGPLVRPALVNRYGRRLFRHRRRRADPVAGRHSS